MRLMTTPVLVAALVATGLVEARAQSPVAAGTHRVFLKNGQALPSYGDAARVGDRLVFNLPIVGANDQFSLQLMSLPAAVVDIERTSRYAETMRATHYAATRGEADFAALTAEVTRNLGLISGIEDASRQLLLAEQQRDRLQLWWRDHYSYRTKDIQKLVGLISDVIDELRVQGTGAVSLDLVSGPIEPAREPLLAAPGRRESVEMALAAALVADIGEERLAILRTALATLAADEAALRQSVARRLDLEMRAGQAYAALALEFKRRAEVALKAGNVRQVEQLQAELMRRDQQLGFRRPQEVQTMFEALEASLAAVRARRIALDKYAATYRAFLAYERRVRPAFSGLDGVMPILQQIRDLGSLGVDETIRTGTRLEQLRAAVQGIAPPSDLASIHATLVSALGMAREACLRRQRANVTTKNQGLLDASAAAAGALLLAERARADLVTALFPPQLP